MFSLVVAWPCLAAEPPPSCLLIPPQQGGRENWKRKSWKLVHLDKDSLISEINLHTQAKQSTEYIYHSSVGNSVAIPTNFRKVWAKVEMQALKHTEYQGIPYGWLISEELIQVFSMHKSHWGRQTPNHKHLSFLMLSLRFYCWAHCMVLDIALVSPGQLSRLYLLPTSCGPPAYSLQGRVGKREGLDTEWKLLSSGQKIDVLRLF